MHTAELLHIAFQFIYEWFLLILKACMFAGEQLIIMEMKPHTLSSGQTLAQLHFIINHPFKTNFHPFCFPKLAFLLYSTEQISFLIYFPHTFLIFSHIDLIFWLVLVWIYCGVFATIEGSIAPHLSPLVPQSGYKGQIWQICWKTTKEVRSSGRSENGGVLLPRSEEHLSLKKWILRKWP